jgi:hypothetical protein
LCTQLALAQRTVQRTTEAMPDGCVQPFNHRLTQSTTTTFADLAGRAEESQIRSVCC